MKLLERAAINRTAKDSNTQDDVRFKPLQMNGEKKYARLVLIV